MTPASHYFILFDKEGMAYWHAKLEQVVYQLGEETLCVYEVEDFKMYDATEKACRAWCNDEKCSKSAEIDSDGYLDCPTLIKNHCADWVAEKEVLAFEELASLKYEQSQYRMAVL